MKFFNSIKTFFKNLLSGENPTSHKRFLALYIGLFLISYIVIRYTDQNNLTSVLINLSALVLALSGVAAWEKIKNK